MTPQVLQQGVESLRAEISCFNMGSILIKPVQRILKYPLILNELLKCTEEEDEDKKDLREAVALMSDVAAFINETKRKKDIVEKYKTEEETTLSRKISKINMHSIGKKSSRMSQKLLTSLGMDSMVILRQKIKKIRQNEKKTKLNQSQSKDCQFEDLEKRFSFLTHSVALFSQNAHVTLLKQSSGGKSMLVCSLYFFPSFIVSSLADLIVASSPNIHILF